MFITKFTRGSTELDYCSPPEYNGRVTVKKHLGNSEIFILYISEKINLR